MPHKNLYYEYRHDLSGSRTKNRYRYELFWGINKIYELFLTDEDFHVIFDYASDIDVIIDGNFELYQLKTKNSNMNLNFLLSTSSGKESIISKLMVLDTSEFVKKLSIVSNTRLQCINNKTSNQESIIFTELEQEEKETIKSHILNNNNKTINLEKYEYLKSNIPITNQDKSLLGETSLFLQNVLDKKMIDPSYFLNYLQNIVLNKATYEMFPKTFDDVIEKKGIKRQEITKLINDYKSAYHPITKEIVSNIKRYTEKSPHSKQIALKKSLTNLQSLGSDSFLIKNNVESVILEYNKDEEYSKMDLITLTNKLLSNTKFTSIFDDNDKICLIFMAFNKLEGDTTK